MKHIVRRLTHAFDARVRDRCERGIISVSSPWQPSKSTMGVSIITKPSLPIDELHILQSSIQPPGFPTI